MKLLDTRQNYKVHWTLTEADYWIGIVCDVTNPAHRPAPLNLTSNEHIRQWR